LIGRRRQKTEDILRLGILTSHPIQYQAPWFRALAQVLDLQVFFAHRPTPNEQGTGFGKGFQWDVDLLEGYSHHFLRNVAREQGLNRFRGCDTPEVVEILRSTRFDAFIVSGWHLKCYWQAARACRRARIPVFVRGDSQLLTPRSPFKRLAKKIVYRFLLRQFDGFLVAGQRNSEYLRHYGVAPDRLFPVPHFVDNEWFASRAAAARPQRKEIRSGWGANDNDLVVLFVGKFIPEKRIEDLVIALSKLKATGINTIGVLVGWGELETPLRELVEKNQAPVRFEGFKNQTELPAIYGAADVLVLPSKSETWGLSVNEAMACGLPAIVSEVVGCAPDLIQEGQTGFTFRTGDPQHLAERLAEFSRQLGAGQDWGAALSKKLQGHSIQTAVEGTLRAMRVASTKSNSLPTKESLAL